jgi:putative transposase
MPEYRRVSEPGGVYFFTVVTFDRQPILTSPECRAILRKAWLDVQSHHPFETIAVCLLPDHLHTLWKIPKDDTDYPMLWREINTTSWHRKDFQSGILTVDWRSRKAKCISVKQGEAAISSLRFASGVLREQRRYWEHTFYEEDDLYTHMDYIHFNALKHGLGKQVADWPWSSFHRYVRMGVYPTDWGGEASATTIDMILGE